MHCQPHQKPANFAVRPSSPHRSASAFSLVEVTLALGIIAFAFVALFGLLPTGLQTFRSAIDATNDSGIMQDMNSMVQVTPWDKITNLTTDVYYFDEEGRRTDSKENALPDVVDRRLYQVKLLVEDFYQPGDANKKLGYTKRIVVIIGDLLKAKSKTDFDSVASPDKLTGLDVRSRTFIVTNMDTAL